MFVFIRILGVSIVLPFLFLADISAQSVQLHGQIIDGTSLENLADVHVYKSAHVGTASDIDGRFHFKVNFQDTVYLSRLGYDSLQIVVGSKDESQQMMLSMHKSITVLEAVEIKASDFQSPTIIKRYQPQPMRIPGVRYSTKVYEPNYHMGLGAIGSPATAVYRLLSKQYKEEKKNYQYLKGKKITDAQFAIASKKLDEAFELIDAYLDPYYYRDFLYHSSLTVQFVAGKTVFDMIKILPSALESYNSYLDEREKQKSMKSKSPKQ